MSQWTNKYAIQKDLVMVQGFVPVDVQGTVVAGEKPPVPIVVEETEEEYFKDFVGGGEVTAPDLGLIKQMLNLVRDLEVSSDVEDDEKLEGHAKETDSYVITKKVKALSQNTIPKPVSKSEKPASKSEKSIPRSEKPTSKSEKSILRSEKPRKVRQQRNAAVASLLKFSSENQPTNIQSSDVNGKSLNLLKPDDFKPTKFVKDSVSKVNGWLQTQQESVNNSPKSIPKCDAATKTFENNIETKTTSGTKNSGECVKPKPILECDATTMFKKKKTVYNPLPEDVTDRKATSVKPILEFDASSMFKRKTNSSTSMTSPEKPTSGQVGIQEFNVTSMYKRRNTVEKPTKSPKLNVDSCEKYVPSSQAGEYYKEYLKRSHVKQIMQEDIWSRAEREMKEIDVKRLLEAELETAAKLAAKAEAELALKAASDAELLTDASTNSIPTSGDVSSTDVTSVSTADDDILVEVISPDDAEYRSGSAVNDKLARVRLTQHRHQLTGDCIVCKVLCNVNAKEADANARVADANVTNEVNTNMSGDLNDVVKSDMIDYLNAGVFGEVDNAANIDVNSDVIDSINADINLGVTTDVQSDVNTEVYLDITDEVNTDVHSNVTSSINADNINISVITDVQSDVNPEVYLDVTNDVYTHMNSGTDRDVKSGVNADVNSDLIGYLNTDMNSGVISNVDSSNNVNTDVVSDMTGHNNTNMSSVESSDVKSDVNIDVNGYVIVDVNPDATIDGNPETKVDVNTKHANPSITTDVNVNPSVTSEVNKDVNAKFNVYTDADSNDLNESDISWDSIH